MFLEAADLVGIVKHRGGLSWRIYKVILVARESLDKMES